MSLREKWIAHNISSKTFSLGDLPLIPSLAPQDGCELLRYYTKEQLLQSSSLLNVVKNGWATIVVSSEDRTDFTIDDSNYLDELTLARLSEAGGGGGGGGGNITGLTNPLEENLDAAGHSLTNISVLFGVDDGGDRSKIDIVGGLNLDNEGGGGDINMGGHDIFNLRTLALAAEGGGVDVMTVNGMDGSLMFGHGGNINLLGTLNMGANTISFIGNGPNSRISQGTFGDYLGLSLFCNAEYEMNWQNGKLTLNGPGGDYGIVFSNQSYNATIQNVYQLTGVDNEDGVAAVGTIDIGAANCTDGELIVIADGHPSGQGNVGVFTYRDNPSGPMEFNFGDGGDQLSQAINNYFNGTITSSWDFNTDRITLNNQNIGTNGNQNIGSTLTGVVVDGMGLGADPSHRVRIDDILTVGDRIEMDGGEIRMDGGPLKMDGGQINMNGGQLMMDGGDINMGSGVAAPPSGGGSINMNDGSISQVNSIRGTYTNTILNVGYANTVGANVVVYSNEYAGNTAMQGSIEMQIDGSNTSGNAKFVVSSFDGEGYSEVFIVKADKTVNLLGGKLSNVGSYTPTGTGDANGDYGQMSWDNSYVYVKTAQGWKRSALSTF